MDNLEEEKSFSVLNQSVQPQAKKGQDLSINIQRATNKQLADVK